MNPITLGRFTLDYPEPLVEVAGLTVRYRASPSRDEAAGYRHGKAERRLRRAGLPEMRTGDAAAY